MTHSEAEVQRIVGIFMENGFKGGVDEARRIATEILSPDGSEAPPSILDSITPKAWALAAEQLPDDSELLYEGWGVIANARDWLLVEDKQSKDWVEAAERWREMFHARLDRHPLTGTALAQVVVASALGDTRPAPEPEEEEDDPVAEAESQLEMEYTERANESPVGEDPCCP